MPAKIVNQIEIDTLASEKNNLSHNNKNQINKSKNKIEWAGKA